MQPYKLRYEQFLNTGNAATDECNAILLHSEGDGTQYPSLFAVDNPEEIAQQALQAQQMQQMQQPQMQPQMQQMQMQPHMQQMQMQSQMQAQAPGMPPMPGAPVPPPIAQQPKPEVSLFMAVNGQQYGPYNTDMCIQMVQGGQLTKETLVWMEGLPAWTQAGMVPALQFLFAPPAPAAGSAMPPIPPVGGGMPPVM